MQLKAVRQTSIEDCGPTCLYMLLKYYGGYEKLETIKKLCKTNKEGTTLFNLKEAASRLGFDANAYHVEISLLKDSFPSPFIAHVLVEEKYYHYIVVYKMKKNVVFIADPKDGKNKKITMELFQKMYLQSILVLYPIQMEKRKQERIWVWLFKTLQSWKRDVFKIGLYSFVMFILEMFCLSSLYFLLTLFKKQNIHLLQNFTVFFLLLFFLKGIWDYIGKKKLLVCNEKIYICLKQKFYDWLFSLPYHEVKMKNSTELFLKLENLENILNYLFQLLFFLLLEVLPFLGLSIFFLAYQKDSSFYFLFVLFELFILILIGKKKRMLFLELKEEMSLYKREEKEVIESVPSICEMQLLDTMLKRQEKQEMLYSNKRRKTQTLYLRYSTLEEMAIHIGQLLLFRYFLSTLSSSPIALENILFFLYFFEKMKTFLQGFSTLYIEKEEIKWGIENMVEQVEREAMISAREIVLKNEKHPYFGNIKNVSLQINNQHPVLLLGKSGIGKSTLAHMIIGDYKAKNRFIEECPNSLKVKGCYVSAEATIYTTSILENILLKRDIEPSRLEEILSLTHVDAIMEEHKYFSLLEGGENLSSGEKQKIILARALVGNFDLLVLDEALNRLDQVEEKEIMMNILRKYRDKMIFVISHRYNLVDLFPIVYTFTSHGQLKKWKGRKKLCLREY